MRITSTNSEGTTEREVPDDIFTFQEGSHWIAAWRHYDLVSQATTEREAIDRLIQTMGEHCLWDGINGSQPFADALPPPADVLAEWERKHKEAHQK